uniref:Uncharacterized protein n=1 Tax=Candidatus Kentrum sp. LFY TaxID=2126342 RepID=A0A450WKB8_9GAMM|nr:MAG: hypothetical protein BECKLFY1418C_GA0070996_10329 [Candidatus Kentron sp. LFY]
MSIHVGIDVVAIEHQCKLHGGMANASIAIDKGMILDKRIPQSGSFFRQAGIKVLSAEGHARPKDHIRLRDRGFQRALIPNAFHPTRLSENFPMRRDYLLEIQQPHQANRSQSSAFLPRT